MKNWKQIANDYYLQGLNNATIFEKYNLERTKQHYSQERVYEHLPKYQLDSTCPHCGESMSARFVGRNTALCLDRSLSSSLVADIHELVEEEPTHAYKRSYRHHSFLMAYKTSEGFSISTPECRSCGHRASTNCSCPKCNEVKAINLTRAAEDLYTRLDSREKTKIDELSCADTLLFLKHLLSDSAQSDFHSIGTYHQPEGNVERSLALFVLDVLEIDRGHLPAGVKMTSVNTYVSMLEQINFKLKHRTAISDCIRDLRRRARGMFSDTDYAIELIELWLRLAVDEALTVLEHYCEVHGLYFRPGEKTTNMIKKSLRLYGLALTARYIYNSVWFSKKQAIEAGYSALRAFNQIYGNLGFWVDDPRARTYTAHPFTRKNGVFSEPSSVSIFSEYFLEPHGLDYLNSPINKN